MKPADRINQLLSLGAVKPYYARLGTWYHRFKQFPAVLIDAGGYLIFATEEEFQSCKGLRISKTHDNHVTVRAGISSLAGYRPFSPAQLALIYQQQGNLLDQPAVPTDEKTLRKKREVDSIIRNQKLVSDLKKLYDNTCQLCGLRLQISPGKYYSEIHHIKPLGQRHNGPDHKANMLCVCPNHHTLLDFFAIRLDSNVLFYNKHSLDEAYLSYHNQLFEQVNFIR
jgi:5-methylcytosine-specific restriction protein A